ncbi:MAG: endo alpha-1,4 polygalactosaminidase [Candidatus Saccharibacteria bacterium]|nr:endo alpha-1,4 polygalactosaminidase [Pseudorhodobacter sp.]
MAFAMVCATAFAPCTARAGPCLMLDKTARSARITQALTGGYGVQYWGQDYTAEGLARQPHGLLVLEAAQTGALDSPDGREIFLDFAQIRQLQQDHSRPLLAYLNLSELEPWRDYWQGAPDVPAWSGGRTVQGEWLARYWTQGWRDVLYARVDRLMAAGADGLFLDDALHYYTYGTGGAVADGIGAPQGAPAHAAAMMTLVLDVASRMRQHDCASLVMVNNAIFIGRDAGPSGATQFDRYRQALDGVMIEDAFGAADNPDLHLALAEDYLSAGLPVLSLDFVPSTATGGLQADQITALAQQKHYVPYIAPGPAFDRLAAPFDGG